MNNNIFDITKITHMYKLDADIKRLTKERDAIKKPISDFMKDNDVADKTVGQYHFSITTYNTTSVDMETLKNKYPAIYDELVTEKEVKRFNM